jgi:hypothetical protein
MEDGKKGDAPWETPAAGGEAPSSPAVSAAGEVVA